MCILCALSFVLAGGLGGEMKEGLNNRSQHNTTLNNTRQDKTGQYHIFCCVWAVGLVCALYCMLAGGLGEQKEEGQLSGVATRHAGKQKAEQRRTLTLHLT